MSTPKPLTARQQFVYDLLAMRELAADEAGAAWHSRPRGVDDDTMRHPEDERCEWCAATGLEILRALYRKGLVRYRQSPRVYFRPDVVEGAGYDADVIDPATMEIPF